MKVSKLAGIVIVVVASIFWLVKITGESIGIPERAAAGPQAQAQAASINSQATSTSIVEIPTSKPDASTSQRTSALHGLVRDVNGVPIDGAEIFVVDEAEIPRPLNVLDELPPIPKPSAVTDPQGRFSLDALPVGDLILAHAKPIGWGSGRVSTLTTPIVLDEFLAYKVKVTDHDGHPLPNARLRARRIPFALVSPHIFPQLEPDAIRRALCLVEEFDLTSDAQGEIVWRSQRRAGYYVKADADGLAPWESVCWLPSEPEDSFSFSPAAKVSGVVVDNDSGKPVSNAWLRFVDPDDTQNPWSSGVNTDSEGKFDLKGPCGPKLKSRGVVRVAAAGFALDYQIVEPFPPGAHVHRTIRLSAGTILTGQVKGAEGKALDHAEVSLHSHEKRILHRTYTDLTGNFRFDAAPSEGKLELRAVAVGYCEGRVLVDTRGALPSPIVLDRSGSVKIHFQDKALAELMGRKVRLGVRQEGPRQERWNHWYYHDMAFQEVLEVPTEDIGEHGLFVNVPGRAVAIVKEVVVPRGGAADVTVTLESGTRVRGRIVRGKPQEPAAGVKIDLLAPRFPDGQYGYGVDRGTTTQADGTFELDGIPAGSRDFTLDPGDWNLTVHTKEIPNESVVNVGDLPLTRLSRIQGRIQWDARPAELPVALLSSWEGFTIGTQAPDADGNFAFEKVIHGKYRVMLRAGTIQSSFVDERTVELDDGDDVRVDLHYGSATIRGRILGYVNATDKSWSVELLRPETNVRVANRWVGSDGGLDMPGLVPGRYLLHVWSKGTGEFESVMREVELNSGENRVEVALSNSSLTCIVKDSEGKAFAGVDVRYRVMGGAMKLGKFAVQTNSRGEAKIRHLESGTYRIILQRAGHETKRIDNVHVQAGKDITLDATLAKESKLVLRALDDGGKLLSPVEARAWPISFPNVQPAFATDNADSVLLNWLSAGEYDVAVRAHGHFPSLTRVTLPIASTVEHTPKLVPAGNVKITVRAASGAPLADAPVTLETAGVPGNSSDWLRLDFVKSSTGSNRSDDKGEVIFDGVAVGTLTVSVLGGPVTTATVVKGETREAVVFAP